MIADSKWTRALPYCWLILGLVAGAYAFTWVYQAGKERGRNELLKTIQVSELQIIPSKDNDLRMVTIRQKFPGNGHQNRVGIDTAGFEGVEATRLHELGKGSNGFSESISLWRLSNKSDRVIEITEAAFTNLPPGFRLKSGYYDEATIRLEPGG